MTFDLGSGFDGLDLSSIMSGSDDAVLPDVSYGGPDEQPSTPTGNGTGVWLTGMLDKAINYAIVRDQQTLQMPQYTRAPVAAQPVMQAAPSARNNSALLLIGGGVLLFLLLKG